MDNIVKNRDDREQNLILASKGQNKTQIQKIYTKRMKFPPLLQQRQLVRQRPKHRQIKLGSFNKLSIEYIQDTIHPQSYASKNPNICHIEFKKEKDQRKEQMNESNKGKIIQTISHSPRRYYLSEDKKKDLSILNRSNNDKNTILQRFIEQINMKQNRRGNYFNSKSLQYKSNLNTSSAVKPLLITKMNNRAPSVLSSFEESSVSSNYEKYKSLQMRQKQKQGPSIKKAQRFLFLKKRMVRRQSLFEPWEQQSPAQQQFWPQSKK